MRPLCRETLTLALSQREKGNALYELGCMPRSFNGVRSTIGRRRVLGVSLTEPGTRLN